MIIMILLLFAGTIYAVDQHQVGIYTGIGYSIQSVDTYDNIYDSVSVTTGINYRWNRFLSRDSINFFSIGLGVGGGVMFSNPRNSQEILNYNSLLELKLFAGYGVGLGEFKQHQVSILGVSFLPKFYGLLERDNYDKIGGTEVAWYDGFYMPISVGVYLPSYRYVKNRFFVGFQHSVNVIVYGNQNINVPKESLILSSLGYQFRFEAGLNYDTFSDYSDKYAVSLENTRVFIETNKGAVLISLFAKTELEDTKFVTVEMFALESADERTSIDKLIAYVSKIPVYNDQAQYTKYWKGRNIFDENMSGDKKVVYAVVKELNENGDILSEDSYVYGLREADENV